MGFSQQLAQEVEKWVEKGIVTPAQAATIVQLYPPEAERPWTDVLVAALHVVAGVMFGVATVMFLVFEVQTRHAWSFAGVGLAFLAVGGYFHLRTERASLGDAVLAAALVPLNGAAFLKAPVVAWPLSVLATFGVLVLRRRSFALSPVAALAASAAMTGVLLVHLGGGSLAGMVAQLALLAGIVVLDRYDGRESVATQAVATGVFAVAVFAFIDDLVKDGTGALLWFGVLMCIVVLGALYLRLKAVFATAAAVLVGDTIVYAFDVGGVWVGMLVLVATAAFILWRAKDVRRFIVG